MFFKKKKKEDNTLMTSGPIWKKILAFSIPLVLGNLFQQLYNIVDSIVVGNVVGKEALGAVGSSGAVVMLLVGFCIGVSAGSGIVTSQFYGAKDDEGVRKAVHTTLAISVLAGLFLTTVGTLMTPTFLRWMNTPEEVFPMCEKYLRVVFGGSIFAVVYNMAAGILNAVGNSRRSLTYLIIGTLSNIALDLVFVAVFKWGVVGAAAATVGSQFLSCFFIIRFLMKSDASYGVKLKDIKFYDQLPGRIIKLGLPAGAQSVIISASNVIVQTAVNGFGPDVMSGFAAYNKIDGFVFLPIMSMSLAITTFVGQNYGAKKIDRVKDGFKVTLYMSVGYAVVAGVIMLFLTPYVLRIFTQDAVVIEAGAFIMYFFLPFYWLLAIFNSAAGAIRGVGRTLHAMIISVASLCGVRVVYIFIVEHIANSLGFIMFCYPITWIIGSAIFLIYMKKCKWYMLPESE